MTGARRAAGLLLVAAVLALPAGPGGAAGALEAAVTRVSVTVRLGTAGTGTFRMTGEPSDAGRVVARRSVVRGTLRTTQTLTGTKGTLVITAAQACTRTRGTWRVVSGTRGYTGASGGGTTNGRIGCSRPFKPTTVAHTGALTVPPPPLATAGTYRGWTNQEREVSFDVAPDGRSLVNLLFGGYGADCVQQQGLRRVEWSGVDLKVAGPVPIADDRSFTLDLGGSLRPGKVSGRFSPGTAAGTISIAYEYEVGGHMWKCASDIPWSVATPAPPPWQAAAGKYCGLTPGGEGVCLDVATGGRELRNVDAGVLFRCGDVDAVIRLTVDGPVPLQSDLSFRASFPLTLWDATTRLFLSGTFDRAGSMTGRLSVPAVAFTYQGTRYTCRSGGAAWTAKLQS